MATPDRSAASPEAADFSVLVRFAGPQPIHARDIDRWPHGEKCAAGRLLCAGFVAVDAYSAYHLTRAGESALAGAGPGVQLKGAATMNAKFYDGTGAAVGAGEVVPVRHAPPALVTAGGRLFRHAGFDPSGAVAVYTLAEAAEAAAYEPASGEG